MQIVSSDLDNDTRLLLVQVTNVFHLFTLVVLTHVALIEMISLSPARNCMQMSL